MVGEKEMGEEGRLMQLILPWIRASRHLIGEGWGKGIAIPFNNRNSTIVVETMLVHQIGLKHFKELGTMLLYQDLKHIIMKVIISILLVETTDLQSSKVKKLCHQLISLFIWSNSNHQFRLCQSTIRAYKHLVSIRTLQSISTTSSYWPKTHLSLQICIFR